MSYSEPTADLFLDETKSHQVQAFNGADSSFPGIEPDASEELRHERFKIGDKLGEGGPLAFPESVWRGWRLADSGPLERQTSAPRRREPGNSDARGRGADEVPAEAAAQASRLRSRAAFRHRELSRH